MPQRIDLFGIIYLYSVSSDRKPFRAQTVSFLCLKDTKGPTLSGNLDAIWILTDALISLHYQDIPTRHWDQTADVLLHFSSDIKSINK